MNKKNIIIVAVAILIVVVIALLFKYRDVLFGSAVAKTLPNTQPPLKINTTPNDSFPLKVGSSGPNVRKLQQSLNNLSVSLGFTKLTVDGSFGPKTRDAVYKALYKNEVSKEDFDTYILPFLNGAPEVATQSSGYQDTNWSSMTPRQQQSWGFWSNALNMMGL